MHSSSFYSSFALGMSSCGRLFSKKLNFISKFIAPWQIPANAWSRGCPRPHSSHFLAPAASWWIWWMFQGRDWLECLFSLILRLFVTSRLQMKSGYLYRLVRRLNKQVLWNTLRGDEWRWLLILITILKPFLLLSRALTSFMNDMSICENTSFSVDNTDSVYYLKTVEVFQFPSTSPQSTQLFCRWEQLH